MKKSIKETVKEDGRYAPAAIKFVYEGLGYVIGKLTDQSEPSQPRHISGAELCEGLRWKAIDKWGRLAKVVLNEWGVKTTRDFGQIVFLLIEHKWMSAQPTDSINDFNDVYDFQTVFEDQFEFSEDR